MKKNELNRFHIYRTEQNEKILKSGFKDFQKFFALDAKAYHKGALTAKVKELMGLVASLVLRCNECILYHLERSYQEGATQEEIYESLNIGLIVGGSITIPHIRYAFSMMEEIEKSLKEENRE